ncbi:MAG: putative porin [Verrucomicrobia bacterium]|nr:putative porin [Verrucomicrobiota bacterium]
MNRYRIARLLLGAGTAAAALLGLPGAHAQSTDALLDKLVEKGILTVKEANELREESDNDFNKAYAAKSGMPDWVTALKINGDFRGRFEGFYADNPDFVDRNRWRYRLRLGVTANLKENFEIGVRLGSGDLDNAAGMTSGSDPISNNQTLQNNASKKGIYLDQAYARWTALNRPAVMGVLTVGKMENPFVFSDLLFDSDYTPEGAAQQVTYNLSAQQALKLNLGQFVLDEIGGSSADPFLLGGRCASSLPGPRRSQPVLGPRSSASSTTRTSRAARCPTSTPATCVAPATPPAQTDRGSLLACRSR